jgi:hypothetical protein
MFANYLKGSSFPEIATFAAAVLVPLFAVYCFITGEHPALGLQDLTKALLLVNFAVLTMATFAVVFASPWPTAARWLPIPPTISLSAKTRQETSFITMIAPRTT